MSDLTKIILAEQDIPHQYQNINFYLQKFLGELPPPPLHPVTREPVGPADLAPLFPMELIKQEVSLEQYIPIPEPVREMYKTYRSTPLIRARNLEKVLDTPAKIYYKYEGASPSGSHKFNTALAQVYYNQQEGVTELTTETGAGQWGSALSIACQMMGIKCTVYMVKVSAEQKPYRKYLIEMFGAKLIKSPSDTTNAGRTALALDANHLGSLGIAISEAVEVAFGNPQVKYALGSVLNHVLLHQTIIGQEVIKQMEIAGVTPDIVIGCHGGGSNFAGIAFPYVAENLEKGKKVRCIAVEPASCPSLTEGKYEYDIGDSIGMTPLMKMYTLGHDFVPPGIHAGGLRYHGASPLVSFLLNKNLIEARAVEQLSTFEAGIQFAQTEGIIPAPESTHAIRAAIDEALVAREEGREKVILFNLSGHGHFDMQAYADYMGGKLK